jgi:prepilin-type N-terminal cleavage/methylation domain-containing protein
MYKRISRRCGVSLIELMVTIVILGLGIASVAVMFLYAYRSQLNAHYTILATAAANEVLEEMRSAGYNNLDSELFASTFTVDDVPRGMGTITMEQFPTATSTNMKRVTVEVSWQGGRTIHGITRASTLVATRP